MALAAFGLAVVVIALCRPGEALAQAQPPTNGSLDEAPVVIYDSPLDQRRAELRQALISDEEHYDNKRERRRLTPEERNALNQELRAILRGVYDQDRLTAEH